MDKKQAKAWGLQITDHIPDSVRRSADAAEKNARICKWKLIVAVVGATVISIVVWQIFRLA